MFFLLTLLATLLEGSVGDLANSSYIVPVAGTIMILGIVAVNVWSGVRRREMESQERLAAIAKGIAPLPTISEEVLQSPRPVTDSSQKSRRAGLVLSSVGVGVSIFGLLLTWIVRDRDVLTVAATGLIPLAIGIGFLIDARLKTNELRK